MNELDNKYISLSDFLEEKLNYLSNHERKSYSTVRLPMKCFKYINLDIGKFISIETAEFTRIIENRLTYARNYNPDLFGTDNAKDIIKAFYLQSNFIDENFEEQYLRKENFCLVIDHTFNNIPTKILRIDLFRMIQLNKKSGLYDFTGGFFHSLKHFAQNNTPITTGSGEFDIKYIDEMILIATVGLFDNELKKHPHKKNKFISDFEYKDYGKFKLVLHFEEKIGIYFLDSLRRD